MSDINGFTLGLKQYFNKILKDSRVEYQKTVEEKTKQFKDDIETEVKKDASKIKKAFKKFADLKKLSKDKKEKLMKEISKVLSEGIFDNINIIEKDGSTFIKLSFKTRTAKEVLNLFEYGSGTLGVKTTRIVWKKVKEIFGQVRYTL